MPGNSAKTCPSQPAPGPNSPAAATNVLSFDIEDWSYLVMRMFGQEPTPRPDEVARQTDAVLELLARHRVRATFFVLGRTAAAAPSVVRAIADAGHEVASHGYDHAPIGTDGLTELAADVRRAKGELESLAGQAVVGYRAPAFSIPPDHWRAFFDVLAEAGVEYDSSVVPVRMPRYGLAGFGRGPRRVVASCGRAVIEFPLSVVDWAGRPWMIAGGGYWRLMPGFVLRRAVGRLVRQGRPLVTYFHNYEFDARPLRLGPPGVRTPAVRKWERRGNLFRRRIPARLAAMLERLPFGPFRDVLGDYRNAPPPDADTRENHHDR